MTGRRKPLIGVLPLVDDGLGSYWMLPGYLEGIEQAGGIPLTLPLTQEPETIAQLAEACDGFLFTGGHDVDPARYGEEPLPVCEAISRARDGMECALLQAALERDRPILGICRGIQVLNVSLGGTLYQDLPTQHPSPVGHSMAPPYDREVHKVTVLADTPLAALVGAGALGVNSYHHQAIRTLAEPLRPVALSEDGLVEGVWLPGRRFVLAVQWHPELFFRRDAASAALFGALVEAAQE